MYPIAPKPACSYNDFSDTRLPHGMADVNQFPAAGGFL